MADGKAGNGEAPKGTELALARAEIKRALAKATTASARLDALISHPKCEKLVPTLPAEDLYFTVKDVGLSDSVDLVRLASPEQFRAFVDLDAWRRDQFDAITALTWLRAAGTDEGEGRFLKKIHKLDVEVLELILRNTTHIHDLEEDPDPEFEGTFFRSTEGRYMIEFKVEGADLVGVKRLLDELYAEDPFMTARLLEALRWETPSELEETAFRWRSGRMQDLGFPELQEALSFFAWLDPDAALPNLDKAPAVPDSFLLARVVPQGSFFDRASALVSDEERSVVERQIVTVLNAVMVVEGVDPGDLEQAELVLVAARDTLSLGLEHASKGDLVAASVLLTTASLKRVFQVGVSLGLRLKYRADRLMKTGKASLPGFKDEPLFDGPLDAVVQGLRRKRPQLAVALEDPSAPPERMRTLRERRDLERAAQALAEAEAIADQMAALGFEAKAAAEAAASVRPEDSLVHLRFSDFALTALARELAGEGFGFEPLAAGKLEAFAEKAFVEEAGRPALSKAAREALERKLGKVAFADVVAARLLEDVGEPWSLRTLSAEDPLPILLKLKR
ncbi:MAG TPA: DUF6178 family protein [Myxococcales bacterium]|jgi:hypothetical protein